MRFTSLIVELIRARPRLIFWLVVLAQAAVWFIVPLLFYQSPPGDMARVLAFGREYQVGTALGPPAAFWLADVAFRLAGNHVFGVYLLSQLCFIITFWAVFRLGRAIVGRQQSVLVILLTATILAFSFPGVEFGTLTLARPLWALILLHAWEIIGQNRRRAWSLLPVEIGLLLLTTSAAVPLLTLLIAFALATQKGRRALFSVDALVALVIVVVVVLPYAVWLQRAGASLLPSFPQMATIPNVLFGWSGLLIGLLLGLTGVVLLLIFNSRYFNPKPDDAPVIFRPPLDPFARLFVTVFAIVPPLGLSFLAALFGQNVVIGGDGTVLLLAALAVIAFAGDLIYLRRQEFLRSAWLIIMVVPVVTVIGLAVVQPWVVATEVSTSLPARAIGQFFGENFERRTAHPLPAVAGDAQIALLIGFAAPSRPHVMLDATPELTPWITPAMFNEGGGVVVWRAADTAGTPPDDIMKRFPGLVPEVPRVFERFMTGRLAPLRIGWAIVRPRTAGPGSR